MARLASLWGSYGYRVRSWIALLIDALKEELRW